ncbi:MAG: hypothetical protein VB074_00090 [Proteiniphilum sp.]|nr:hypothetical protein [Proteiniphilum sp.]
MEVFIKLIEVHENAQDCSAKFFEDIQKYYPRAANMIKKHTEINKTHLRNFLLQGIKEGYIREDLNVNVAAFLVEKVPTLIYAPPTSKSLLSRLMSFSIR